MSTFRKGFLLAFIVPLGVDAHGYLKSPRSRNWVAKEDGKWSGGNENTPEIETCPHCLNRNTNTCGKTGGNDYDYPINAVGGPMPVNIQATYTQGQEIELTTVLTAHHKGHFEYKACPIQAGEQATQTCFDANPLIFVRDVLYPNAPNDLNYPERAYIPLSSYSTYKDNGGSYMYTHIYELPSDVSGDLVLIQWHYVTGNSCVAVGYDQVSFPKEFDPGSLRTCGPLSSDGNGTPEQFWNCAEVQIQPSGPVSPPISTPISPPVAKPTTPPVHTPAPIVSPVTPPVNSPIVAPTLPPVSPPPPTTAPVSSPTVTGTCPSGYTGLYPDSGCTGFFHCSGGVRISAPIKCPDGLLFNSNGEYCDWPANVNCPV